jgi:histidine triad (HIT) family protein
MDDCLFCKIIKGEVPSDKIFENEYVYAFKDINPVAPVHILVIPKKHIISLNDIDEENDIYITEVMKSIKEIAKIVDVYESGYRVISNTGKDANQVVKHLHFHILGGKFLGDKIVE